MTLKSTSGWDASNSQPYTLCASVTYDTATPIADLLRRLAQRVAVLERKNGGAEFLGFSMSYDDNGRNDNATIVLGGIEKGRRPTWQEEEAALAEAEAVAVGEVYEVGDTGILVLVPSEDTQ